jgi:ATP-dependent Clp protease, protease subunit
MLVDKESGEIFIYGPIGYDFWDEDGITAESVIEALDGLGGKRAIIRINSPGGIADQGVAIYNALRRYKGGVDTIVDSVAASAASVVALAGESRLTASGGRWMIHRAMGAVWGNRIEVDKYSEMLGKYDAAISEIYREHMAGDLSTEQVLDLLTAETWYTTDEAIEAGLSTGKERSEAAKPIVASWFKNAPQAIFSQAAGSRLRPKFAVRRQAAAIHARA